MFAPGTVLLHDNRAPAMAQALLFADPVELLVAHDSASAERALHRLAVAGEEGLWAAGYLAYELGYLFEERLRPLLGGQSKPLLWFGLYREPVRLDGRGLHDLLSHAAPGVARNLVPRWDEARHGAAFDKVAAYIAAGDSYQVNLTFPVGFDLEGDPVGLYRALAASQPVAHGALIHAGDHMVLSRSPELFVSLRGDRLEARPMKGTVRRHPLPEEDGKRRDALAVDAKNRAENLMIVDLLRNDLGRIAEIGSVKVTDLFSVETYPSLHTLTSGIVARRRPDTGLVETLRQLFPCGSVTGAPKLRAMEIIAELEEESRGVYTGSIGHIAPNGDFAFNVAIRTAVIDANGRGRIGIGGGVVADSDAGAEYQEALLKMSFLADPAPPVTLIETYRWTPEEGFVLADRHLDRLLASAAYFGLPADPYAIEATLAVAARDWTGPMRVRLTLSHEGLQLTALPLPPSPERFRFLLAPEPLRSDSVWLAHKTTNRGFYDGPRAAAHDAHGVDEVVFSNERGELTEGSFTNLFVMLDGRVVTPPLSSGLLPGTLRAELLATGKAEERVLTLADLHRAEAIWLGNSVRGLIPADLVTPAETSP